MTRLRRSFTAEFKLEAASLVLDQGYSVPEASRSLDVGETILRRWVQQLQSERTGTTPIGKALTPEQQKIQELEARINRLEREKDILKKPPPWHSVAHGIRNMSTTLLSPGSGRLLFEG